MNLIRSSINQPVTVIVGILLVLLAGMIALTRLPIQLTPNVEATVITVTTLWEGASPEEVEQSVVDPQEERLSGISDLRLMTSSSAQGVGTIRLEFNTGAEKAESLREVSDKLRQVASYPENVDEPVITVGDEENRDYIAWIVFGTTDPSFDVRTLRDFAIDRIEPVLERVPGIAEINVLGGRERELQIRVDPIRMAQLGVTPTQFAQVIRQTNQNVSAGMLADGKRDIRLRTIGQYESVDEIERTVVATREGGIVHVGDIAEVTLSYKEPSGFVRSCGKSVIAINAEREIGSNIMQVMEGLRAEIARLDAPGGVLDGEARRLGLNGTLTLTQVYDQTVYIEDALALVRNNIWIGGGLAIMVLLLFLRSVRTVAIIGIAIPISIVGAVVAMVILGRSVNVISLAGMAFAVGMVVDNAIVVLENIFRHLEMGKSARLAAFDGAREVWGAVLASTLTTIVVFVPILLVQEEAGQLFRDIALAICAAVGLSLLVSITVVPCAAGRLMGRRKAVARREVLVDRGISARIARMIYLVCGSVIARVVIVAVLTGVSVYGTFLLMPPADYLPAGNRNLVFGLIIPPPGYNLQQFDEMGQRIEEIIEPFWEAGDYIDNPSVYARSVERLPAVPTFNWFTQQAGEPVTPPSISNFFIVTWSNILFQGAVSDDPDRVVDLLPLLSHATRPEVLPGVVSIPLQAPLFQLGGSTGSAVKVQLAGPDLDEVIRCAEAVMQGLRRLDVFSSIQSSPSNFSIPAPEIQIRPDLVRLSELGLTTADIGLAVSAAGDGAIVDEYYFGGETIDLKIISANAVGQAEIVGLEDLPIATPSGHVVPLNAIAKVQRLGRPEQIARVGRQRAVSFEATPAPGVPLEEAMRRIEGMFETYRTNRAIPPSITTSLAGSASKLEDVKAALLGDGTFIGTLGSSLVLALLVVYLLLCVLFQSFLRPLVIMLSVPLATLGGFAALFGVFIWSMTDRYMPVQMLDVLTMLGFVILIGVVVNNAILIVHQSLNFMHGSGTTASGETRVMPPREAIAEAVRSRIRPIFMSTLTSIGGMAPLVFMPGAGSELYRGLGSVVVGGLLLSTIFTILLVPLLLSLVIDVQMRMRRPAPEPAASGAVSVTAHRSADGS